jgi:pSer/pThr/pTyr-binding forkhead associated (FHA) protein
MPDSATHAVLIEVILNEKLRIPCFPCKIGRGENNDIVIDGDRSISRNHCLLFEREGRIFAQDTGSRNGTSINGTPVTAEDAMELRDGDILRLGLSRLLFQIEKPEDAEDRAMSSVFAPGAPAADVTIPKLHARQSSSELQQLLFSLVRDKDKPADGSTSLHETVHVPVVDQLD